MRSIDWRIPAIALVAVALVSVAPAFGAEPVTEPAAVQFITGTGAPLDAPTPGPYKITAAPGAVAKDGKAQGDLNEMAGKLSDPQIQDGVAIMVAQMTETMMRLPVGKFAAAVEKSVPGAMKGKKRISENATVADLAGHDANRLPADLAKSSKQMMGMLSGFAAAFATMMPELEKMGDILGKEFQSAHQSAD